MAKITVRDMYEGEIQATNEMRFIGKDNKEVFVPAKPARKQVVVVAEYDEYRVPFVLPEHFDSSRIKKGDILNVTCPQVDVLKPFQIKNVNQVISGK